MEVLFGTVCRASCLQRLFYLVAQKMSACFDRLVSHNYAGAKCYIPSGFSGVLLVLAAKAMTDSPHLFRQYSLSLLLGLLFDMTPEANHIFKNFIFQLKLFRIKGVSDWDF